MPDLARRITTDLPDDLVAILDDVAARDGLSAADIVESIVKKLIEKLGTDGGHPDPPPGPISLE